MKVLVSAYACEPAAGSEPGVGWNWVEQISRHHEVWVLTRQNNRAGIERALQQRPRHNVHWVYVDLPRWLRFWKRGRRGIHAYYCMWQVAAYLAGRRLDGDVRFDVVHHVTFVNYWLPTFLPFLAKPFIWGPVGGGESVPRPFLQTLSPGGRWFERLRDTARAIAEKGIFVRRTVRVSRAVLVTTKETASRVQELGAHHVQVMSQVALAEDDLDALGSLAPRSTGPFRAISIGRFVDWKGFHLALAAFAEVRRDLPSSEYWLVGDGPARTRLERIVRELGLDAAVTFLGPLPRAEVFARLAQCDVLVHPSLHESGGWVCAEAMAARRPVVCLALGGPALQVTPDSGYAVSVETPNEAIQGMANALVGLARDADLRARMGEAARQRARQHCGWTTRGDFITALYHRVAAGAA